MFVCFVNKLPDGGRAQRQRQDLAKTDEEMVYLLVKFGRQPRLQVESTIVGVSEKP